MLRVWPFAALGALGLVLAPFGGTQFAGRDHVAAAALMALVGFASVAVRWERLPAAAPMVPAFAFLGAVALLRPHAGGADGVGMLGLLAVIWMALYAPRRQLLGVLAGYAGVWALPLVFAAGTADPGLRWSTAALAVATAAIAGATVQSLVASVRRHADELEQRDRERTRLLARVETLAQTDALTGLPNRRAWDAQLQRELADRRERDFCIAALDLDHFKELNDAEGHAAGDRALRTCAATWEAQLRPHDILARIGGDEFSVLLADCALAEAVEIIERLRGATPAPLTCSAGVAHRCEGESSSALQARADAVLYAAKRTGRARTASAEPAGA